MPNVSISLTEKNIEVLDRIGPELGLSGRSETIRAALRSLDDELRGRKAFTGTIEGALIAVEDPRRSRSIEKARHSASSLILAQIHTHLCDGRCAEVMILRGPSSEITALVDMMRADVGFASVRFLPW
jgi:metal-responsive CopG/Arc/MetJ family transcriptional regulator